MADIFNMADTWNNGATTFTAIKMDVTDSASNAASLLLDLQVGSSSKFKVSKSGGCTIAQGSAGYCFGDTSWGMLQNSGSGFIRLLAGGVEGARWNTSGNFEVNSQLFISGTMGTRDTGLKRVAAAIVGVTDASTGGAAMEFTEQTAPSAGAANTVRLYAEDNGSGKTRLMARFNTGAAQQVAIEP